MMTDTIDVIRSREPDAEPIALIGWYMPFAGVRYYKLLTDVDIALENDQIGPVGWRTERTAAEQPTPREAVTV